jgi:hypothetical protein
MSAFTYRTRLLIHGASNREGVCYRTAIFNAIQGLITMPIQFRSRFRCSFTYFRLIFKSETIQCGSRLRRTDLPA